MEEKPINNKCTFHFLLIAIFCCIVFLTQYDLNFNSESVIRKLSNHTIKKPPKIARIKTLNKPSKIAHVKVDIYHKPDALRNYGDRDNFQYNDCLSTAVLFDQRMFLNSTDYLKTFRCSHLMTLIDHPSGRLGNLMFKAATLIGVATWHSYTPVFKKSFKLFETFNLINRINFSVANVRNHNHKICCKHAKALYELDRSYNWSISGYPHSWKYFKGAEDRVKQALTFKTKIKEAVLSFIDSIKKINVENICIHVRRGDYLQKRRAEYGMVIAPISYIQWAMDYFRNKFKGVQFIFVSDDIKWCKKNFNETNIYFSPFKDAGTDMALLASCDHVIVTSGSFGWWGAWLAGGITLYYPEGYARPGSVFEAKFNKEDNFSDYYPRSWIRMMPGS